MAEEETAVPVAQVIHGRETRINRHNSDQRTMQNNAQDKYRGRLVCWPDTQTTPGDLRGSFVPKAGTAEIILCSCTAAGP
jgi:hypothetical protein